MNVHGGMSRHKSKSKKSKSTWITSTTAADIPTSSTRTTESHNSAA
jgi:hypothetical protein